MGSLCVALGPVLGGALIWMFGLLASAGAADHSLNLHVALSAAAAGYCLAVALAWIAIRPAS